MSNYDKIGALILEYQEAVAEGVRRLNSKYLVDPTFHKITEDSGFENHGYVEPDKRTYYEFHGISGCFMKWENGRSVDFNLGTAGRCDGFDPWFVFNFFSDNDDVRGRYTEITIEAINDFIDKMKDAGVIVKDELHRLYYFIVDYNNPDPFRWADGEYPEMED